MTFVTASTQSGAKMFEYCDTTLELSEVLALFSRDSLSDNSRGVLMLLRISTDLAAASWKDSEIVVG